MIMKRINKALSLILCIMLIVVMALFTTGCNDNGNNEPTTVAETTSAVQEKLTVGEGSKQFDFTVVDGEGKTREFVIKTDKTTVGEALLELDFISGDEGEFGLYVKEVLDVTADYEKDGTYWAFYINDEYASTGVDATDITEGNSYTFKVEK